MLTFPLMIYVELLFFINCGFEELEDAESCMIIIKLKVGVLEKISCHPFPFGYHLYRCFRDAFLPYIVVSRA